jgi:hypothetical protein
MGEPAHRDHQTHWTALALPGAGSNEEFPYGGSDRVGRTKGSAIERATPFTDLLLECPACLRLVPRAR